MYIRGLPLINPAYPLDIKNDDWLPAYLSDRNNPPPLDEEETAESLLKKYFSSPADEEQVE